jgi:adenylate cyclase class 2
MTYDGGMKTEIEVKFLDVDFSELRQRLASLGAVCEQPMRLMRRAVIQNETTGSDAYIRVRDEGDKVTLTYKSFESLSLHGASEIETTVGDFDSAVEILSRGGMKAGSYQESRRETWKLGEAEVVLDEWPWLKPYIEIEGESEEIVREAASKLGFDWEAQAVFGDIMVAYRAEYPHLTAKDTVGNLESVRFDDPLPPMFTQSV